MRPIELEILLHYYCFPGDWCRDDRQPPIFQEVVTKFLNIGFLRLGCGASKYEITERGYAHVEALKAVPYPERKETWVTPSQPERRV